jgi:hypothetical protein
VAASGIGDPRTRTGARLTVAFVALAAAVAVSLWTRPTVIRGEATAAMLLDLARVRPGPPAVRADCDRRTVVGPHGARLQCTLFYARNEQVHFDVTYGTDGRMQGHPIASRTSRPVGSP